MTELLSYQRAMNHRNFLCLNYRRLLQTRYAEIWANLINLDPGVPKFIGNLGKDAKDDDIIPFRGEHQGRPNF